MEKKIKNLVDKILNESLQEKADQMVDKIKSEMQEEEVLDIENMSDDEIYDAYCQKFGCDDIESETDFDGEVSMDDSDSEEMDMEDEEDSFDWKYRHGKSNFTEDEYNEEMEEGNAFTDALNQAREEGEDSFEVDGKKYPVKGKKKESKENLGAMARIAAPMIMNSLSENKKNIKEKLHGKQSKLDVAEPKGKLTAADFKKLRSKKNEVKEKWEGDVDVKKTGEYADMSIEELNGAIKKLKDQNEKLKEKGKKVPDANKTKMSQLYFAKRSKKGWPGKGKTKVSESLQLTESEMIDLIEKLVIEAKEKSNIKKISAKGEEAYSKAHKESGKENEDYIKSVTKKLKDYLKDGSKGEYNMNPKTFPKGNGELGKMEKKAYMPSDSAEEYIENFARMNGMDDLSYDEIHPIDDWMTKNIEGSSITGNNPEWANTAETEVNKRLNSRRKKGLVSQLKKQAYNKAEQPIVSDNAGEDKSAKSKVNKIFKAVESEDDRKDRLLKEEISKINRFTYYEKKTQ